MISGYFYNRKNGPKQIKKIVILFVEANLLYAAWSYFYGFVSGSVPIISLKTVVKFVVLNDSPFSGHLWYLGAILYTLIFVSFLEKIGYKKVLYRLTPILLLGDLVLRKYSLLIFGREFPYIIVRNCLFVGLSFFSIGMFMREKN